MIAFTRESSTFTHGLSPRGAMALLSSARSWAFMEDREYVVPEDVQAIFVPALQHRAGTATGDAAAMLEDVLSAVAVP
ncbi:MAG: hypothetical protein VW981_05850 [Rhodobiaceae bacterium]